MQKTDDPFLRFFRRAPKQARSRALVGAVISAFEEQLANNESLGPLRLEQLIERAGVGIGSFYEYFSNKDSLVGVLIGQVTERNFQALLAPLDHEFASVEAFANEFALHVARTFLEKPYTTRMAIDGIGRFGLLRTIVLERDRFVGHLTPRVQPFFPTVPAEELHERAPVPLGAVPDRRAPVGGQGAEFLPQRRGPHREAGAVEAAVDGADGAGQHGGHARERLPW
jgi:AcrR family transcriptional regulator